MVDAALTSSSYQDWQTPPKLFHYADTRYGPFDLDAAADRANALTNRFLDVDADALNPTTRWTGRVWVNPPYGRAVKGWPLKASAEVLANQADLVCMLLGARTDTAYWARIHETASEVVLLNGRLTFKGECVDKRPRNVGIKPGTRGKIVCGICGLRVRATGKGRNKDAFDEHIYDPAPFPSALIIWRRGYYGPARYEQLAREVWR
jgi:phage N-6-adenine-methyltransferase